MSSVTIEIGSEKVNLDVDSLTHIDQSNLDDEFAKQASLYAYVAMLLSKAKKLLDDAKTSKELLYAMLDKRIRDSAARTGTRTTEKGIEQEIIRNDEYVVETLAVNEAQHTYDTLKAIVDALQMKSDMLINLGAHLRSESNITNLHIKELLKKPSV